MRSLDTNVLVRLLVRDDKPQLQASEAFVAQRAWVSQLVLAESFWVLEAVYGRSRAQLVAALELLLTHDRLVLQDADVVTAALARFRRPSGPGFSDCLVLEVARKAGHLPLGSFDRHLSRHEGAQRP